MTGIEERPPSDWRPAEWHAVADQVLKTTTEALAGLVDGKGGISEPIDAWVEYTLYPAGSSESILYWCQDVGLEPDGVKEWQIKIDRYSATALFMAVQQMARVAGSAERIRTYKPHRPRPRQAEEAW